MSENVLKLSLWDRISDHGPFLKTFFLYVKLFDQLGKSLLHEVLAQEVENNFQFNLQSWNLVN